MKRVVITGATSFLGRNVVQALLKENYVIHAFVRKNSPNLKYLPVDKRLHLIYGDLAEIEKIKAEVDCADIFIHFAWDGSGNIGRADPVIQENNISYAMRALAVADSLQCNAFIFPGSQAEYGIHTEKITEMTQCNPVSPYGRAKLRFGEEAVAYCKSTQMRFIHMRIFSIYGYGDRPGTLVDTCVRKFNNGELMEMGACSQIWNYLYIDDFATIVLKLIQSEKTEGIYNVAGEKSLVLKDYVMQIYEISNKSGRYSFENEIYKPEGVPNLAPDISKLRAALGTIKEISFSDGIREIMRKMKESNE